MASNTPFGFEEEPAERFCECTECEYILDNIRNPNYLDTEGAEDEQEN